MDEDGAGRADVMASLGRALEAEPTVQRTLQTTVEQAVHLIPGCWHAAVSIVGPDGVTTPAATGAIPAEVDELQYETGQGPCLSAIRDHGFFVTGDLSTESRWPDFATRASRDLGVHSMLSFRLFVAEDTLGALNLYSTRTDAFDRESIETGRVFAAQAALALSAASEHARAEKVTADLRASQVHLAKNQQQAAIAVALQRSMLTELPDMAPLEAAALYHPAVPGAQVGGDWYDALVLDSGAVLAVVGDLAGHNLEAAAAMAQARSALRTLAVDRDRPPGELLDHLDHVLQRLEPDRTGTCVVVRLTSRDGGWHGELANAGHPPPLLITDRGGELVTAPPQLLLNVRAGLTRRTWDLPLAPGAILLLYTDGLVEQRRRSLADGLTALVEAASTLDTSNLTGMCHDLLTRLAPRPTDDVCILAIRIPRT